MRPNDAAVAPSHAKTHYAAMPGRSHTCYKKLEGAEYNEVEATSYHAALTSFEGGNWSSVLNILSQKRLVTPNPFSKSAKWCCK